MVGPFSGDDPKNGNIDLVFMIEAPRIIKSIPVINSFYKAIRKGIMYVKATGKYNSPKIEPVTLSMIRSLFSDYIGRDSEK